MLGDGALLVDAARLADLDEQTTVTRTPDGRLRITGLVESSERKLEILRTLAPVANNPALNVEIKTVAEAVIAAQKQRPASSSSPAVSMSRGNSKLMRGRERRPMLPANCRSTLGRSIPKAS